MNPVSLTAGQHADTFLLISAAKVKTGNVGTGINGLFAKLNELLTITNLFPEHPVCLQVVAALVNIGN